MKHKEHLVYDSGEDLDGTGCFFGSKDLSNGTGHRIVVIADLDLWNGHRTAYKFIGSNIKDILNCSSRDSMRYKVFVKGNDVYAEDYHHDGCNTYRFRLVKDEDGIEDLTDKIYEGDFTEQDVRKHTASIGKLVNDIYGFGKKASR